MPLLVFGLHLTVREAAPVGLIAVGMAALLGALLGLRDGTVRYRAAGIIGLSGMVVTPLGLWAGQNVPTAPLTIVFALILAYVAQRMFRRSLEPHPVARPHQDEDEEVRLCALNAEGKVFWTRPCARALVYTGLLSGFLSGLLGVGGGFVIVPALTRHTALSAHSILATSLAVIALVSFGASMTAAAAGLVNMDIALPFSMGSVVALLVGRLLARRITGHRLQQAFSVVAAGVAVLMVVKGLGLTG